MMPLAQKPTRHAQGADPAGREIARLLQETTKTASRCDTDRERKESRALHSRPFRCRMGEPAPPQTSVRSCAAVPASGVLGPVASANGAKMAQHGIHRQWPNKANWETDGSAMEVPRRQSGERQRSPPLEHPGARGGKGATGWLLLRLENGGIFESLSPGTSNTMPMTQSSYSSGFTIGSQAGERVWKLIDSGPSSLDAAVRHPGEHSPVFRGTPVLYTLYRDGAPPFRLTRGLSAPMELTSPERQRRFVLAFGVDDVVSSHGIHDPRVCHWHLSSSC